MILGKVFHIFTFLALGLSLLSCLPEQQVRTSVPTANNSQGSDTTTDNSSDSTLTLPQTTNFLQLGTVQTTTTLSVFSDYSDSFLLRGNNIISYLKDITTTSQSNLCLIMNFPGASGTGAINTLVTSARIRSYYNPSLQSKEYFLQVEPNNETINQGDCLSVSLINKLTSIYGTSTFAFKLSNICPNCNVNISSTSLRLFNVAGEEQINANIANLFINIIPAVGTTNSSSPVCNLNANCTSIGFNCCLSGQCVNHGETRNEVDQTSDKFLIAQQLIAGRPELIVNYEDIFYICPEMVPTDATGSTGGSNIDPVQQAADLFTELENLYNCTTPSVDEFSICVLDYPNASSLMSSGPYTYSAAADDLTFSTIANTSSLNNIVQIDYGGVTYFKEQLLSSDTSVALDSDITLGSTNDNLILAQTASFQKSLPVSASNDTVSIYYKVDGTCERLGTTLARCKKYYKQGQSSTPTRTSDHASGNYSFALPTYADTSFNVIVEIGGSTIPQGTDTWSIVGNNIVFNSSEFPIFDNQELEITYFVSSNVTALTQSKNEAQEKINDHCACDSNEDPCTLNPVSTIVAGVSTVTSFTCVYPEPDVADAPLQTTVYVSAKTVPQKFYDEFGVNYDLGDEASEAKQEGNVFEYTDGNYLRPNNVDSFVGFNEIYGSMNVDAASPFPPKVVTVERGKSYDIFVESGAFSTCLNCGADYYSGMQKVFPNNFANMGGGYVPDTVESRRRSNQGDYPGDDLRFGRACFLPATMIPWTHVANSDLTTQRQNRMSAQHFLFANGYNKDWFGFDYGSLIGSFDGIKWFAIGNQRRIKAESTKLYLAVNGYFGDLTISNAYEVTVSEMSAVLNAGSLVTHDSDSDGAECQQSHFCEVDEDCIAQLGYDYTCQNVSSLTTSWPQFDANGEEISGSVNISLTSLLGGTNGQPKRCVYRGIGSICSQRNMNVNANNSYTNSSLTSLHSCSQNSYCENISQALFNTKIARYAESPASQNIQSFITEDTDTFGLGARRLGRPYDYYGTDSIDNNLRTHFNSLNVDSICIPGKDVSSGNTLEELNFINLSSTREADKINNVGRTIASTVLQDENYFAGCPATDEDGNFTHFQNLNLNSLLHNPFAIRNNLSTNSLLLNGLTSQNLFNDNSSIVQRLGYHQNTCLRAPGAKCFSDFECAPNNFISTKVKSVTNFNGEISDPEINFWSEELVCANSQDRYQDNSNLPNPVYETFEHKCCRETGLEFTYTPQPHENPSFRVVNASGAPLIPGMNQNYNDPERYSRTHVVYDKLISEPSTYPSFVSPTPQPGTPLNYTAATIKQYNTLHLQNSRMCCTGHWVRKFADGTNGNGGGSTQGPLTQQNFNIEIFKPLSWNANNVPALNSFPSSVAYDPTLLGYTCTANDYQTADCEVKNIVEGSSEEQKYINWFSKFELIGIPQVLIETNNDVQKPLSTDAMDIDGDGNDEIPREQMDISAYNLPLDDTIKDINVDGTIDATFNGVQYYSAASYENFEIASNKLKKVYSEDEFKCCIPTGFEVSNTTPNSACCSGLVDSTTSASGVPRCCLPDFTNVSVYTNRYVSSEGAYFNGQEVSDSDIDETSGYISPEVVERMATTMCCSGRAVRGKVINDYLIPIDFDGKINCATTRRWLYLETLDNDSDIGPAADLFNAGVRWNNHVYCVPEDFDFDTTNCSGGGGSGAVSN